MGSLYRRRGSPFVWAAYIDHAGKRLAASTKKKTVREAKVVLARWEAAEAGRRESVGAAQDRLLAVVSEAVQEAGRGGLTEAKVRSLVARAAEIANGTRPEEPSVSAFLLQWLEEAGKDREWAESTAANANRHVHAWVRALGRAASLPLSALTFDHVRAGLATFPGDQGPRLKTLRHALNHAVARRLIDSNPAKSPALRPKRNQRNEMGLFTADELDRLIASASDEWQGMILIGSSTGLRLNDISALRWDQIDWGKLEIVRAMRKTKRLVRVPVGRSLEWLVMHRRPAGDVFQTLCKAPVGALSVAFSRLMKKAGVPREIEHDGQTVRRSFHSLRHAVVTALMKAQVDPRIARELVGHLSAEIHGRYSHADAEQRAEASRKAGLSI